MPKRSIIFKSGAINSDWLLPRIQEYFDVQFWQADKPYTNKDILWQNKQDIDIPWTGPKILERFWDEYVDEQSIVENNVLSLCMPSWIRFNESIWYKHLGYDQLIASPGGDKFFLMLMNGRRQHRTRLFKAMTPYLEHSLYSYHDLGIQIPGDETYDSASWQRYCNINWYNQTQFSLVAESTHTPRTWISEKTYKPMAFGHPFIVHGSAGLLQFVKSQGFVTFDHIIDEQYDTVLNSQDRFNAVKQQVELLYQNRNNGLFLDTESQARIRHNRERFFDDNIINQIFLNELITPLQEFLQ